MNPASRAQPHPNGHGPGRHPAKGWSELGPSRASLVCGSDTEYEDPDGEVASRIILITTVTFADSPPERGPCAQLLVRFFYNPAYGTCQRFYYGGCRGNGNNFKTLRACQQACRTLGKGPERVNPPAWAGQLSKLGQAEN
ncbi:unnamed protein product [Caretta caretta]